MRKIKKVLRLRLAYGLSFSEIARALQLSKRVTAKYVDLAHQRNLDWTAIESLNEARLASQPLPQNTAPQRGSQHALPNFALIHQELKNKCMPLQLLWHEHVANTTAALPKPSNSPCGKSIRPVKNALSITLAPPSRSSTP